MRVVLVCAVVSTVFRGKHMAEVMNAFDVRVAVVGNHDFDLGLDQLVKLAHMMPNTKWVLSNVFDTRDGLILGGFADRYILQHAGIKFGFLGLVEAEWIATLSMDTSNVQCKDPIEVGNIIAKQLREEGAEVIIALTHSRMPNDVLLAKNSVGIDLILGGHDHEVYHEFVNGIHVAKSGTEFRYGSVVTVTLEAGSSVPKIDYELVPVDSQVEEDPVVAEVVKHFAEDLEAKMRKPIGWVTHALDIRASFVRTNECEVGNLLTDIMRNEVEADFAILNSGTLRTDSIVPQGYFTMKDLFNLLPFEDLTCKTEVTGKMMRQAMENGVSQWPKHEGRFPQISGFSFTFDPNLPPGARVTEISVNGKPMDENKTYTLACKPYISIDGKDGYDCFLGAKSLISLEECQVNSTSFANYLRRLAVIQIWKHSMESPTHETDISDPSTSLSQHKDPILNTVEDAIAVEKAEEEKSKNFRKLLMHQSSALPLGSSSSSVDAIHSIGAHWAKASIGPPRDPKQHHFQSLVHNVLDHLPQHLAIIDPIIEGRIKMVPFRGESSNEPKMPSPVMPPQPL